MRQVLAETNARKINTVFNFSRISLKEANIFVEKPCIVISDFGRYLAECWESSLQTSRLNDSHGFGKEIWVGISGDKGGGSTKLVASFLNFEKPQSVHNVHILGE